MVLSCSGSNATREKVPVSPSRMSSGRPPRSEMLTYLPPLVLAMGWAAKVMSSRLICAHGMDIAN